MKQEKIVILSALLIISGVALTSWQKTVGSNEKDKVIKQLIAEQEKTLELQRYIAITKQAEQRARAAALKFSSPIETYYISSECGMRQDPLGGDDEGMHKGIDIVGKRGVEILAAADGIVVEHWLVPGWHNGKLYLGNPTFGGMIIIEHRQGVFSLYGHLSETDVYTGKIVKRGDVIGKQGSTGVSTAEHLHFELIIDPNYIINAVFLQTAVNW
jgi:murein DD-endopeptidase MepM/ murein hydrolase activator NlpD